MIDYNHDNEDYEAYELRAQVQREAQHLRQRIRHPKCQDPEHPGCWLCEPELFKKNCEGWNG